MKITYCDKLPDLLDGQLVIIDGKTNLTRYDYFKNIWSQLDFSYSINWDAYNDWMRDLSWIHSKTISIIISNFNLFLSKDDEFRNSFMDDFERIIFPYWENVTIDALESPDDIKDINVYCLTGETPKQNQISAKSASMLLKQNALNGMKSAHSTSIPVLRIHENNLCFASFVFFYSQEEIQAAKVRRPAMWVVSNLKTGEITQRYSCQDKEFSKEEDRLYDISAKNISPIKDNYWNDLYTIMDLIIDEYLSFGTINKYLYKQYLNRIYDTTPEDYTIFYKNLSNIEL